MKRRKIKLFFLVRPAVGGMQRHLIDLLKNLDSNDYTKYLAGPISDKLKNEISSDVEIFEVPIADKIDPLTDLKSVRRVRKLLRKIDPDILHIHGNKAALIGTFASRGLNLKRIVTVHNFQSLQVKKGLLKFMSAGADRYIARRASKIISVSNDLSRELKGEIGENLLGDKLVVIHNGVEHIDVRQDIVAGDEADTTMSKNKLIGFIGRFADQKQPLEFVKLASRLISDDDSLRFLMVGSGPLLDEINNEISKNNLKKFFSLMDYIDNVSEVVKTLDIFVMTSKWEGLPYMILEVMSAGIPIVSTNVGGVNEVITNGEDGLLVQPGVAEEFVSAVKKLLYDDKFAARISINGKERISKEFSLTKMVEQTTSIYNEVVDN